MMNLRIKGLNGHRQVLVRGDKARLEDVLRNILSNAIKYSPNEKHIVVSLQVVNENALIMIKDKGIGINKEHLDAIFDSFFRGNNFAGNDPGGMGLGLYICKDIIVKHGGYIWAENNSDKGSTFYIQLPIEGGYIK